MSAFINLGPHAVFIWSSYAIVGVTLAALVGLLIHDGRRQQQRLDAFEARGVRRRTASARPDDQARAGANLNPPENGS